MGDRPAYQIAPSRLFDRGHFFTDVQIFKRIRGERLGNHLGMFLIPDDDILLLVLDMDLEHVELVGLLPPLDQGLQVEKFTLLIEAVFRDIGAELACRVFRLIRRLLVIQLGDLEGPVQGVTDADAEPVVDAVGEKVDRNEKQKNGRDERQADERRNKPSPEFRPGNSMPPFVYQFHQIPDDQKDEQDNQDDVDIDQSEYQGIAGDGERDHLAAEDAALQIGHNGDEHHRYDNDDPLPFAPFRLPHIELDRSAGPFSSVKESLPVPVGFKIP